jgi:hypothetical protein
MRDKRANFHDGSCRWQAHKKPNVRTQSRPFKMHTDLAHRRESMYGYSGMASSHLRWVNVKILHQRTWQYQHYLTHK